MDNCAAYAPTEAFQSDSNKDAFYKELGEAYNSLKRKSEVALVLGNFDCPLLKMQDVLLPR